MKDRFENIHKEKRKAIPGIMEGYFCASESSVCFYCFDMSTSKDGPLYTCNRYEGKNGERLEIVGNYENGEHKLAKLKSCTADGQDFIMGEGNERTKTN